MPVAHYGALASKYGRVATGSGANFTILNLSAWEARAQGADLDTTHFESDVSADNVNVFGEGLVGVLTCEFMVRGSFDAFNNPLQAPILLLVGYFNVIFLGITKTFGLTAGYRCLQSPITCEVNQRTGFESRLSSNGLINFPNGNLAQLPGPGA
jgi:hypothetical protein